MHQNTPQTQYHTDIIALVGGAILPFAFAPYHFHLLALFSPAILLWCWHLASPKECSWRGFLFGLGFFGGGVSWVYTSMHQFAHLASWQALSLTAAFVMYLASMHALQGYLLARFYPQNDKAKFLLLYPASWVMVEWLRSTFFSGFPWLQLAFSQTDSALSGLAPILGAPGVTFVLVACASSIVLFTKWQNRYAYAWLIPVILTWGLALGFSSLEWTAEDPAPFKISLVQGNLTPHMMWSTDNIKQNLQTYVNLSQELSDSDVILWPENAIPIAANDASDFLESLDEAAKQTHTSLLAGIPIASSQPGLYHNGIIALGQASGQYHKRNLVPFGEYTPFRRYIGGLLDILHLPMSNYIPGESSQPALQVPGLNFATYICYEIAYAGTVWHDMPTANMIVTISNDGWFGHSIAAAQHLQIAQFRSLQTARYQLFATNTGITAAIDPHGNILKQAKAFTRTSINSIVYRRAGYTPWILWGDYPMLGISLILLITLAGQQRKRAVQRFLSSASY